MNKPIGKQKLIVVSDAHRGAAYSKFASFEQELVEVMKNADHVVFNGDMFELFYINPQAVKAKDGDETRKRVSHAIKDSAKWLAKFLEENPNIKFHFVLGNHENIKKIR